MNLPPAAARAIAAGRLVTARLRHGRPRTFAARMLGAFVLAEITVHCGAGLPATAGTLTGIMTWLVLSVRGDLAPPPSQ